MSHALPAADVLVRVAQIVGNPKAGIPALIPISRSSWFAGVKSGKYPPPDVRLGARTTCWRLSTIARFIERSSASAGGAA